MSKEAIVVLGSFLVIMVGLFIAFIIYHFITQCKNCPNTNTNSIQVVYQEVKVKDENQNNSPWYVVAG